MAHVTGNAAWQDFPSTTTPITAAKLNALEGAFDTLYTSEYGSATRTQRTFFRAYHTGFFLAGNTDQFMGGGWTVAKDTDSAWVPGAPSYYQIPISGRAWDLFFILQTTQANNAEAIAAKITMNGTSVVANSIVTDLRRTTAGDCNPTCYRPAVQLYAGDKLYFSGWTNIAGGVNTGTLYGGVVSEIMIRDVGPA